MHDEHFLNFLRETYSGKRVLITGHTGFKGAWLSFFLKEVGANVIGYSDKHHGSNSLFVELGLIKLVKNYWGDVGNHKVLKDCFLETKPDFVFHLAAQAIVRESYENPVKTFLTNVMGSVNVLDIAKNCSSLKSLIMVTSDKCYENMEWPWGYRENDKLGGKDPYSASKAAAELVIHSYKNSYFDGSIQTGLSSVRAGNVIGGGDWSKDRIVPDCVRAISENRDISLRKPAATRPWQHVLEPLSGYMLLAGKLAIDAKKYGGSWNFGPANNEVRTVKEVAEYLIEYFGHGHCVVNVNNTAETQEANLLQLNCDKANNVLNWSPRWGVDQAIEQTAEWYKRVLGGEPVSEVTKNQIENYFGGEL